MTTDPQHGSAPTGETAPASPAAEPSHAAIGDGMVGAPGSVVASEQLSLLAEAAALGTWETNLVTGEVTWSERCRAIFGVGPDKIISFELFLKLVDPAYRADIIEANDRAIEKRSDEPWRTTYRIWRDDSGEECWIEEYARVIFNSAGSPERVIGTVCDVTSRIKIEQARERDTRRLSMALKAGRMVAWEHEPSGAIVGSANAPDVLGIAAEHLSDLEDRVHPDDRALFAYWFRTQEANSDADVAAFRFLHPDGSVLWLEIRSIRQRNEDGSATTFGVLRDITENKMAEERLRYAATHDSLTGLANRTQLQALLEHWTARAVSGNSAVGLLLVDLDHFKDINDSLGHDAGDALLRGVAKRMTASMPPDASVVRLGGDEFAVVVPYSGDRAELRAVSERLQQVLCEPFHYRGAVIATRASIGVALFPEHELSDLELLKGADLALYAAKDEGRGCTRYYSKRIRDGFAGRIELFQRLEKAIEASEIVPYYQPKVDLKAGRIVGFEALARWIDPERGVLSPAAFASAFEDKDLSLALHATMMRQIFADIAEWRQRGLDCGRIAVNLSTAILASPQAADQLVADALAAGVPPAALIVEVTETVFLDRRAERMNEVLCTIRNAGIKIALDDFGTGFASLSHLRRFPVDEIKIDKAFVRHLQKNAGDAAIVAAVIGLGHDLGLSVVAEGVETAEQARRLQDWGCRTAQGFLFARPMPSSRVPYALSKAHTWPRDVSAAAHPGRASA